MRHDLVGWLPERHEKPLATSAFPKQRFLGGMLVNLKNASLVDPSAASERRSLLFSPRLSCRLPHMTTAASDRTWKQTILNLFHQRWMIVVALTPDKTRWGRQRRVQACL